MKLRSISGGAVEDVVLMRGASGSRVRQLQENLSRFGFDPGRIDGNFDERTAEAVVALQRKLGLDPSGDWCATTDGAVRADLAKGEDSILERLAAAAQVDADVISIVPEAPEGDAEADAEAVPEGGGLTGLLKSPGFWLVAGAAFLLLARAKPSTQVSVDGLAMETGFGDAGEDKPKRKPRKRKPKRTRKSKETEEVEDHDD